MASKIFIAAIIISYGLCFFALGRTIEAREFEKDFLEMKEKLANNWMECK